MKAAVETRSNTEWLADLREPTRQGSAVEELRVYLRKALASVLRAGARVDESDLDDFAQDSLVRVLQGLDGFRGDSRFTTWATAVAVRVALGALRRRRYEDRSLEDLALETFESATYRNGERHEPGRELDRRSLLETLGRAIDEALTKRQRIAVLGELAGVPSTVLIERLGTNANALYKLHHDARKKLRCALNEAGFQDEDVRRELLTAS